MSSVIKMLGGERVGNYIYAEWEKRSPQSYWHLLKFSHCRMAQIHEHSWEKEQNRQGFLVKEHNENVWMIMAV
jgi:hypothetical protein